MLKAFFDTGNAIDSRRYDIVTLGGFSARATDWPEFDRSWLAAVGAAWGRCDMPAGVQPFLHTTDMLAGNEPFSRRRGWTGPVIAELLMECAVLIARVCDSRRFRAITSSILLKHYRAVKAEGFAMAPVQDVCSSFCAAQALAWCPEFADEFMRDGAEFYFDQNEPFRGSIANRLKHGRLRRNEVWRRLQRVDEVDSRLTPAIQASDLLVWSVNAYEVGDVRGGWQLAMASLPRENQYLGQHSLRNPNQAELDRLFALGLPKRAFR